MTRKDKVWTHEHAGTSPEQHAIEYDQVVLSYNKKGQLLINKGTWIWQDDNQYWQ